MDTLDRYIIKEFLLYLLATVAGLVTIYLLIDFFSRFWSMNMPLGRVFLIYLCRVPESISVFFPIGILMSTLLLTISMSRQNEVLAVYLGGMGIFRLTSTFVTIVSILSTIAFVSLDTLVPALQKKQFLLQRGVNPTEADMLSFFPSRSWYKKDNQIFHVGGFDPNQNTITDVNIFDLNNSFDIVSRLRAGSAKYTDNDWLVKNGVEVTYPNGKFPVGETFQERKGLITYPPDHFKTLFKNKQYLRLRELRLQIRENKALSLDSTSSAVNYHERLAIVFSPLIFTLLAIPIGTKPFRNYSMAKGVGFTFFIVMLYLVLFRFSLSLGKGGHISPIVAGWTPNVLFFIYAMVGILRHGKSD